jgi:hypothetical protein
LDRLLRLLAVVTLISGCASAPTSETAAAAAISECKDLNAEIAAVEEAKRESLAKQQDAWKVVIPFAVLGRYAGAKSAVAEADQRLNELRSEFAHQNCRHDQ